MLVVSSMGGVEFAGGARTNTLRDGLYSDEKVCALQSGLVANGMIHWLRSLVSSLRVVYRCSRKDHRWVFSRGTGHYRCRDCLKYISTWER